MQEDEIQHIVDTAVKKAVEDVLLSLGINVKDPLKSQQTMANIRSMSEMVDDPEFRADQLHLRQWRKSMESASKVTIKTAMGMVVTGVVGAVLVGVQHYLGR